MKALRTVSVLAWTMLVCLAPAGALTVLPMDLRELTAGAELIFIGTATEIRSERAPHMIYSYVTFSDLQIVKGTYLQDTLEIRLAGGTVAGETVDIPGMPKFVVGGRDLIFAAGNLRYICPIVGWGQGRFSIRWDEASGKEVVFDDAGIPVKEIRGDEIIRAEPAVSPEDYSPGIPDTGEAPVPQAPGLEAQESQPGASVEGFIAAIEARMGISPANPQRGER